MKPNPSAWVLCSGEPLAIDPGTPRLMRASLLSERLARQGFRVDFWSSNFDHTSKKHRAPTKELVSHEVAGQYRLHLLPSSGYVRNVSLARVVDHRQIGRAFLAYAPRFAQPDVLVLSMPTIDLACAGAAYAEERGIPFVLDLRDLWPEIFYMDERFPKKQILRLLTAGWSMKLNRALRKAAAVVGVTEEFVDWGCERAGRRRRPELDRMLPLGYPTARDPTPQEDAEQRRLIEAGALRPDMFQICFIGSLSHRMDLATLCEAGKRAHGRGLPVHLVVAGSGEVLDWMRASYESPNVRFLGRVDQTIIRAILRTSSVGVVPYRNSFDFQRALPNKAIEYLSQGLPILTCLRGTMERLVTQGNLGAVYDEHDPEGLLDVIARYCHDRALRDAQSAAARAAFARSFSAEVVFDAYQDLVQRVIAAPAVS
jgi:glycosyltransferase involved in cell wall biosynthesis